MLTAQYLIAETDRLLATMPEEKLRSVYDFVTFLCKRTNEELPIAESEEMLRNDISVLMQCNPSFDFLHDEPDLYTENDLVEKYK